MLSVMSQVTLNRTLGLPDCPHAFVVGRRTQHATSCGMLQVYDGVKVDVFAAGAMLFMMLTGCPPFGQATRRDERFRRLVCFGDVQGLLEMYNLPRINDQVRSSSCGHVQSSGASFYVRESLLKWLLSLPLTLLERGRATCRNCDEQSRR